MSKIRYADPSMAHVDSFATNEGLHRVAQQGANFIHATDVKQGSDPVSGKNTKTVRNARISRQGDTEVLYAIEFGTRPDSATMSRVMSAMPADMRSKKVIIRGGVGGPAKL